MKAGANQQQSRLCGHFALSPGWQLNTLIMPFFPQIFFPLAIPQKQHWLYPCAKFSKTPSCNLSFLALSVAERHGELPSDPYLCARLPLMKWNSNGHRLTRRFMLEDWNFVFPDLFKGWTTDFFIHSVS